MNKVREMNLKRITIGTASFERNYGILHKKVIKKDARSILEFAMSKGIQQIDTAVNYGESEKIIGWACSEKWINRKISTKIGRICGPSCEIFENINKQVSDSIKRLRVKNIHVLYLHNPEQLFEGNGEKIFDSLTILKKHKKIENIGFSFYDPYIIEKFIKNYKPDVVQIPFNIFDQRLIKNNYFMKYTSNNIKINIRSIYLQGLLLTGINKLPKAIRVFRKNFLKVHKYADKFKLKPIDICNSFLLKYNFYDSIIVGFNSVNELKLFLNFKELNHNFNFFQFRSENEDLISPKVWS